MSDDDYERGAPVDREAWRAEAAERGDDAHDAKQTDDSVSAVESDARLLGRFDHEGVVCELGECDAGFVGFVRLPASVDRLDLLWAVDPPGAFGYGPDGDGWIGFDTENADREVSQREAAMALAGLAAQVADRARASPE